MEKSCKGQKKTRLCGRAFSYDNRRNLLLTVVIALSAIITAKLQREVKINFLVFLKKMIAVFFFIKNIFFVIYLP